MGQKFDAYEQMEFNTNRIVYVELLNGNHITCCISQIMGEDYNILPNFRYNSQKGVYEECQSQ